MEQISASSFNPPPNSFTFYLKNNEPIIVIDEVGFKYKGELIEDGGEIYRLFKEFLQNSQFPKQIDVTDQIEFFKSTSNQSISTKN